MIRDDKLQQRYALRHYMLCRLTQVFLCGALVATTACSWHKHSKAPSGKQALPQLPEVRFEETPRVTVLHAYRYSYPLTQEQVMPHQRMTGDTGRTGEIPHAKADQEQLKNYLRAMLLELERRQRETARALANRAANEERAISDPHAPDVLKQDCERLVEGRLVFAPSATMREGKQSLVFARLSRGDDVQIMSGLEAGTVVLENTKVSCLVSMKLDSQEKSAFQIDNIPDGRKDEQLLLANQFTQWDWRVTPLKAGKLHLLLYVTPKLFVDGVGQGLKEFPQPPRIITVSPDYMYELWGSIVSHWAIWSSAMTVVVVPSLVWISKKFKAWRAKPT